MNHKFMFFLFMIFISPYAIAQLDVGSDGSDGVLDIAQDTVIDLGEAATGNWDMPSPVAGNGVYDPEKWVVVFKYQSVQIGPEATLRFENYPSNPPVVWLVQGDVVIEGSIDISGQEGGESSDPRFFASPGPGGFRGGHRAGLGTSPSAGFGPGGAHATNEDRSVGTGGSFATLSSVNGGEAGEIYGNPAIFPLIGGSGGAGSYRQNDVGGGGAGGGAILIACNNLIVINGLIDADGGVRYRTSGSGSGGAIKLIANRIEGSGQLTAKGQSNWNSGTKSGDGRVRIETNENLLNSNSEPPYTVGEVVTPLVIFPDETTPSITPISLGNQAVPNDPRAEMNFPNVDMSFPEPGLQTLLLEASNVPTNATVTVRVIREGDLDSDYLAEFVEGDQNQSQWQADVELRNGHFAVQAFAKWDQ